MASTSPVLPQTLLQLSTAPDDCFSWSDELRLLTLSDNDLKHLTAEVDLARAVLYREQERRHSGITEPTKELSNYLRISLKPLKDRRNEATVHDVIERLTEHNLFQRPFHNMPLSDQARLITLAINDLHGFLHLANPDPSAPLTSQEPACQGSLDAPNNANFTEEEYQTAIHIAAVGNVIPEVYLSDESISWDENGRVAVTKVNHPAPREYIHTLLRKGILYVKMQSTGRTFHLAKRFSDQLSQKIAAGKLKQARQDALWHVCRIFPKDGELEPISYTRKGYALLGVLRATLHELWRNDTMWLNSEFRNILFDTLLSATEFGALEWKTLALHIAGILAVLSGDHIYELRVVTRRLALMRLHHIRYSGSQHLSRIIRDISVPNRRSAGYVGKLRLLAIKHLMDVSAPPNEIQRAIQDLHVCEPSKQEFSLTLEGELLYVKRLRHGGKFMDAASHIIELLLKASSASSRLALSMMIQYGELLSEQGNHEHAYRTLHGNTSLSDSLQSYQLGAGRKLKLARATTQLMGAIDTQLRSGVVDFAGLGGAEKTFSWLRITYAKMGNIGKTQASNRFQALCGLAMCSHVRGGLEDACDRWLEAKNELDTLRSNSKFTTMVIRCSYGLAALALGHQHTLQDYGGDLDILHRGRYDAEYYYTGLATHWTRFLKQKQEELVSIGDISAESQSGIVRSYFTPFLPFSG